jgi:hypothetical protein
MPPSSQPLGETFALCLDTGSVLRLAFPDEDRALALFAHG